MMTKARQSDHFPTDAIRFEVAKASESNGGFFKLSMCASVKVSVLGGEELKSVAGVIIRQLRAKLSLFSFGKCTVKP
jgi:hypothetical protein